MVDLSELIGLDPTDSVLELVLRVVLYIVIVAAVLLTGKRDVGQASGPHTGAGGGDVIEDMAYGQESVLEGVVVTAIWVGLHALTAYPGIHWPHFEEIVGGRKTAIVRDGVVMHRASS